MFSLNKKKEYQKKMDIINKIISFKNYSRKNKIFYFKPNYNSIIPLNTYVYWHSKDLPPLINKNYQRFVNQHPRFNHYLFDEEKARTFISEKFPEEVLNAYDSLIPSAFKCDLWRYCILYINGGIYLDIKYTCVNRFRMIALTEKEYFVKDIDESGGGIYNALIVSLPNNDILKKAIYNIVENVKNNFYGTNGLDPTGPLMLKKYFADEYINNLELKHGFYGDKFYIECNGQIILKIFDSYRSEQKKYVHKHHSEYYAERNIYK